MVNIKIFTDSSCDLDLEYLKELDIEMIPLTTHFDDESYKDRIDISPDSFYDKLNTYKGAPKTSQVSPSAYMEAFKPWIEKGYKIISINLSSKLSGTYQSACLAEETLNTDLIEVIDSKSASIGMGLIVTEAALMVKAGKPYDEIVAKIIYMRDRVEHVFAVGSLDMLRRGGRLSGTQALVGTLLNIKPILQFNDGQIVPYEKVRGQKAVIKILIDTMRERAHDIANQRIGLAYSVDIDICNKLKEEISIEFGVKDFIVSEIGAVVGSHVGPGTIGVFFLSK